MDSIYNSANWKKILSDMRRMNISPKRRIMQNFLWERSPIKARAGICWLVFCRVQSLDQSSGRFFTEILEMEFESGV